jgi:twitching motility two-component system response regulator PilH
MPIALVVDDSPISQAIVAKLVGGDYTIVEAMNGAEALEFLSRECFDLLLLDLLMPVMDGAAVLAAMKDRGIHLPVVVMTADLQERTRDIVAALGGHVVLNKPLTRAKLLAAIAEANAAAGTA